MRTHPRLSLATPLAVLLAACGDPWLTDAGDVGTVRVTVRDERGTPVPAAAVRVQMPNASGGQFEVGSTTRADGSWTLGDVPAGARRVTVTPPAGYEAAGEPLVRVVTVTVGQTTRVDFTVRARATAARGVARPVRVRLLFASASPDAGSAGLTRGGA